MPKYKVIVECRNEGGADIHCWSGIEAPNGAEAEHLAVQRAARYYPEFDEFEPVRTEAQMPSENKPRVCTIFYCDRRRKSVCCSDCGFRRRGCYNSCKNDPAKCGLCKAPDLEGTEEKE